MRMTKIEALKKAFAKIAFARTHPKLVSCGIKAEIKGDCRLAAPFNLSRGISSRKLDSF